MRRSLVNGALVRYIDVNKTPALVPGRRDSHGSPAQVANHFLPNTGSGLDSTSLQAWGILRHLDALAAYTFTGDLAAKEIALGNGSLAETYMGQWSDAVPVTRLWATDYPQPAAYDDGNYTVDWDKIANPRGHFPLVPEPSTWALALLAMATALVAARRR